MSEHEISLPLTYAEISKILPHRYPFLLVDRVMQLERNERIHAYKNVTANEPFFDGHFPGLPIMPGVLQIEAIAQAGGILTYFSGAFAPNSQVAFLAGVDSVKFRRPVVPGDRLDLEVELLAMKRGICKFKGMSSVGGERACEATIIVVVKDR